MKATKEMMDNAKELGYEVLIRINGEYYEY